MHLSCVHYVALCISCVGPGGIQWNLVLAAYAAVSVIALIIIVLVYIKSKHSSSFFNYYNRVYHLKTFVCVLYAIIGRNILWSYHSQWFMSYNYQLVNMAFFGTFISVIYILILMTKYWVIICRYVTNLYEYICILYEKYIYMTRRNGAKP